MGKQIIKISTINDLNKNLPCKTRLAYSLSGNPKCLKEAFDQASNYGWLPSVIGDTITIFTSFSINEIKNYMEEWFNSETVEIITDNHENY